MTNKLSPHTVYVPVLNEFPALHNYNRKLIDYLDLSAHRDDDTYTPADVFKKANGDLLSVATLQKQQLYTFTKEELEDVIKDAFCQGQAHQSEIERFPFTIGNPVKRIHLELKEYIQSLF